MFAVDVATSESFMPEVPSRHHVSLSTCPACVRVVRSMRSLVCRLCSCLVSEIVSNRGEHLVCALHLYPPCIACSRAGPEDKVTLLCGETLGAAFDLFDGGRKGHLTQEELQALMRG